MSMPLKKKRHCFIVKKLISILLRCVVHVSLCLTYLVIGTREVYLMELSDGLGLERFRFFNL